MINKAQWHDKVIELLSNPMESRSWKEIALEVGVSVGTLWKYRRDHPELLAEVDANLSKAKQTLRPAAYKALSAKIAKGELKAIELFFKLSGELVEKQEIVQHLSVDQKRQLAQDLIRKYSEKIEKKEDKSSLIPPTSELPG